MPKTREKIEASPLVGEALLKRVQELENLSKEEKAIDCGYYTLDKDGNKRLSLVKFLNALLETEGINWESSRPNEVSRGGRTANFRIKVQANGSLLVGSAYTKKLNCSPGDEFEIALGRKHIRLNAIDK